MGCIVVYEKNAIFPDDKIMRFHFRKTEIRSNSMISEQIEPAGSHARLDEVRKGRREVLQDREVQVPPLGVGQV